MLADRTPIDGLVAMTVERVLDERGYFGRTFATDEFAGFETPLAVVQANVSYNEHQGTLRGMHLQRPPHAEIKLVRCVRGEIWDVVADPRPGSPTFGQWWGTNLSEANGRCLYIAAGLLHGFVTLEPASEVEYLISAAYAPRHAAGVRWDDPTLAIGWPVAPTVISARDRDLPDFDAKIGTPNPATDDGKPT